MSNGREMKGTLVLMTKNVLNFNHNVTKADDISTSKIDMHLLGAADKNSETPSSDTYIPRDENFGHLKSPDFLTYGIKLLSENVITQFKSSSGLRNEFDKFDDIHKLFENGLLHHLPEDVVRNIKEISPTIGERFLKFPTPDVIRAVSKSEWMTDDEFGREMLAGVNPCVIQRLQELPPKSKLDASKYGDQTSTITREHLKNNLGKLTVEEALSANRLFILDHHDAFLPYLKKINELPNRECYATRTILFLKDDGTLKPLAIELSQPNPEGDKFGAHSTVILPAQQGVKGTIWLMAKAYVLVNDSNYHQLVTHWLNTHAIIEPFVIATNRNLSVLHPIHKLLSPHYRGTMNVNGIARQSLFNAGGIIEQSFLPGRYALEMSSAAYKNWVFTDQALPNDLVKRGMAIKDQSRPHGVRLVIKDYPYAVDGLEIWSAIETWVKYYVDVYYTDSDVNNDTELRDWWKEVVEKGHGDLKDKPWWPKLKTREDLYQICSIIIWTASGLHAAVNFGQYPYGGYILNRPTLSTRLIPVEGKAEYDEMVENPEKAYLSTFTPEYETLVHLSVIEILSRHASDEVYLGQRDNPNWIDDKSTKALQAFQKFGNKLKEIEDNIKRRNRDSSLRNRNGPVQMPYTVLLPNNEEGLTFRGIPNSISI
ncbi:Linoleate 9S-lipoxygenase [Vigna angularis]|uniref:Lipoxygenase n=1 Tax=Phaseolus angularis TaxID=3914 RepID=A0A8T0JPY6_PHAAN|nr:Linoleate 9S-lipoxygenase [Vigna angularis]